MPARPKHTSTGSIKSYGGKTSRLDRIRTAASNPVNAVRRSIVQVEAVGAARRRPGANWDCPSFAGGRGIGCNHGSCECCVPVKKAGHSLSTTAGSRSRGWHVPLALRMWPGSSKLYFPEVHSGRKTRHSKARAGGRSRRIGITLTSAGLQSAEKRFREAIPSRHPMPGSLSSFPLRASRSSRAGWAPDRRSPPRTFP